MGVKIEKIRKIEADRQEKVWMVVITLENLKDKGNIIRNKWKLKERNVWIEEDLTWQERKM